MGNSSFLKNNPSEVRAQRTRKAHLHLEDEQLANTMKFKPSGMCSSCKSLLILETWQSIITKKEYVIILSTLSSVIAFFTHTLCPSVSHYQLKNKRQRSRCIVSYGLVLYILWSLKPLNVRTSVGLDGLNQCREKDAALAPAGFASISLDGARNLR